MDFWLELAVEQIVRETSDQLCGDKHLETAMKKFLLPKNHAIHHEGKEGVAGAASGSGPSTGN